MNPDSKEGAADDRTLSTEPGDHQDTDTASLTDQDIAAQLRRRRCASQRLEPLESGRRDPWHYGHVIQHPVSRLASLRTYYHLRALGLLSEDILRALREAA